MRQVNRGTRSIGTRGIPLTIRPGHTVRLETTNEPLTGHSGLVLFDAMAEDLAIPQALDRQIQVKVREAGYPESEHLLALAANAFVGGEYLDDLEALREDLALQRAIGRHALPDPTTAGDFCRRFSLGHVRQLDRAMREILQTV